MRFICGLLVFQTTYRDDPYAVLALVGARTDANQYHHERRSLHLRGVYLGGQFLERGSTFFYQIVSAQFDFNETVSPVSEVYHRITFQTVLVPIVIYGSSERIRVDAQVSHTQCLKQQTESLQIVDKSF